MARKRNVCSLPINKHRISHLHQLHIPTYHFDKQNNLQSTTRQSDDIHLLAYKRADSATGISGRCE